MGKCLKCGANNESNATYCEKCGAGLSHKGNKSPVSVIFSKHKLSFIILFAIIGLGLITGIIWYIVPHCPRSCDDGNACTIDSCSNITNFNCVHQEKKPCDGNGACEVGEYNISTDCPICEDNDICTKNDYNYILKECLFGPIDNCCGNKICEDSESYEICPADCESERIITANAKELVLQTQDVKANLVEEKEKLEKDSILGFGLKSGYTSELDLPMKNVVEVYDNKLYAELALDRIKAVPKREGYQLISVPQIGDDYIAYSSPAQEGYYGLGIWFRKYNVLVGVLGDMAIQDILINSAKVVESKITGDYKKIDKPAAESFNPETCKDVQIALDDACVSSEDTINLTIKTGPRDIALCNVKIFRDATDILTPGSVSTTRNTTTTFEVPVTNASNIRKVEILPRIRLHNKFVLCSDSITGLGNVNGLPLPYCKVSILNRIRNYLRNLVTCAKVIKSKITGDNLKKTDKSVEELLNSGPACKDVQIMLDNACISTSGIVLTIKIKTNSSVQVSGRFFQDATNVLTINNLHGFGSEDAGASFPVHIPNVNNIRKVEIFPDCSGRLAEFGDVNGAPLPNC